MEKGFAEADVIVEDEFDFPMIYHYSMEPHTAIAQVDSDGITIWTSTGQSFRRARRMSPKYFTRHYRKCACT